MKAPSQLRRRTRPSSLVRLRSYWLVAVVGAVLAAIALRLAIGAPAFRLAALNVTGLEHVGQSEVVRRAAIDPLANIWLLDRRAIERRIAAIPYVASARVHRRPLGNVSLEVTERRLEGCVHDAAGAALLVDGDLRVLEAKCPAAHTLVYKLRGALDAEPGDFLHDPELLALQKDYRILAASGTRCRMVAHDGFGQLEATLPDGIAVRFGDDGDLSSKQRLIAPILAQLGPRAASVRAVDLRAPATPVVEYGSTSPAAAHKGRHNVVLPQHSTP